MGEPTRVKPSGLRRPSADPQLGGASAPAPTAVGQTGSKGSPVQGPIEHGESAVGSGLPERSEGAARTCLPQEAKDGRASSPLSRPVGRKPEFIRVRSDFSKSRSRFSRLPKHQFT